MSKDLWTSASHRRALALAGALLTLFGVLGGCGPREDAAAIDDGAGGLALRVTDEEGASAGTQAAQIGLSTTELRFSERCPGASGIKTLEIRSTGTSSLTIRTLTVRGGAFRLVSPPPLPAELPSGERLVLRVRFSPPVDRPNELAPAGTLIINSSASGQPSVSVALRGSVPPVQFSLSPTLMNFGSLRIGLPRIRNLELRNTGACALEIGGFDMSGDLAEAVLVDNPDDSPLGAGESRDVEVMGLCERRGTIDALASFFTTYGQSLGTLRVRGVCRP